MSAKKSRLAVYAVAIRDEAILLCQISAGHSGEGLWALPGGGVDWGEHPEDALVREVYEETGLEFESFEFLGIYSQVFDAPGSTDQLHLVGLIYAVPLDGVPRVTEVDGSTCDVRWIPLADLSVTPVTFQVDEGLKLLGLDPNPLTR